MFTGHVQDTGTPFMYMNARYYEPGVARFLTPDSYTGNPYNPNTQNVYSYTGGNPVNYVDPTGHIAILAGAVAVGAIAVIAICVVGAIYYANNPVDTTPVIINSGRWPNKPGDQDEKKDGAIDLPDPYNDDEIDNHRIENISQNTLKWLNKGEANNSVYYGLEDGEPVYTGLTRQELNARLYQHRYNGKMFTNLEEIYSGLTRNQARAIEQYYIENGPNAQNIRNSISPYSPHYEEALQWAQDYIEGGR